MYNIESLLSAKIILSSGKINPNVVKILLKQTLLAENIIESTVFLDKNVSWAERVFCIIQNISKKPKCMFCQTAKVKFISGKYKKYCSNKCATLSPDRSAKAKETNIKRYGVEHFSKTDDFLEKMKDGNMLRFGVDHPAKLLTWQDQRVSTVRKKYGNHLQSIVLKVKETKKQRYGHESYNNKQQRIKTCQQKFGTSHNWCRGTLSREHFIRTMVERYGVDNWFKQKDKITQSIMDKYGVENPQQSLQIREKTKQTNFEKYGIEEQFSSPTFREKIKQINLERYGVEHVAQKHMVEILPLLMSYVWLYDEYVNKKKTATQIAQELSIDKTTIGCYLKKHDIAIRHLVGFSYKCIQWLDSIMAKENIFIQHAHNIGEYRIPSTRFFADGYCKETNTIYEFYGDFFHGNLKIFESHKLCNPFSDLTADELYQKTIERENKIKALGYNLVVMWENEWEKR
ncbi:MAG: DUF7487 domain-containing protein [Nitrosopumilaceae archaeon]